MSVAAASASVTYLTASRGFPADDAFIIRRRSRESMPSRDSAPANCTVTSANENDPSASSEKCRTIIHDSRNANIADAPRMEETEKIFLTRPEECTMHIDHAGPPRPPCAAPHPTTA